MARISAICLSDLHLGSETSVLTAVNTETLGPDIDRTSPVLESLAECLKTIAALNDGAKKPRLVLAGDVLELALATDNVAATVFAQFARLLFRGGQSLVDRSIIYVPGNHDHHLWETARESQYAAYLREPGTAAPLKNEPWHCTHLFPWNPGLKVMDRDVESCLLTTLLKWCDPPTDARVLAMYPNFGVLSADPKSRCAVVHHGHFTESIYYLMTDLGKVVFPARTLPHAIWDLEAENYAWIDFLWGTLGRSGNIGKAVGLVYDMLKSEKAKSRLAKNVAQSISDRVVHNALARKIVRPFISAALNRLMTNVGGLERGVEDWPLSTESWNRLDQYVGSYVSAQLKRECKDGLPQRLTFVFGHTHKPFEEVRAIKGIDAPVYIYNTGGWVVDTIEPSPHQGAAIVVIDEDGNAASIRMYSQAEDPSTSGVQVMKADDGKNQPNPLYDQLVKLIDPKQLPWSEFSKRVAEAIGERHRNMAEVIRRASG